jgi:septation ring formation regulator EzrA
MNNYDMKNIIIVALIVLTLIAFVYAFFQQTAANRSRVEAELNAKAAIEARAMADVNASIASNYQKKNTKLRDSLKNCKGR